MKSTADGWWRLPLNDFASDRLALNMLAPSRGLSREGCRCYWTPELLRKGHCRGKDFVYGGHAVQVLHGLSTWWWSREDGSTQAGYGHEAWDYHSGGAQHHQAVEKVDQWISRAQELQLVLPDALVLMNPLTKAADVVAKLGGSQHGYRISEGGPSTSTSLGDGVC